MPIEARRVLLLIYSLLFACLCISSARAQHQDNLPGQPDLVSERSEIDVIHVTTITIRQQHSNPNPLAPSRFLEEQTRLAQRLARPKGREELKSPHPRHRLLSALYAFDRYCVITAQEINRFKDLYGHVPARHKAILHKAAVNYDAAFPEALELIERNGKITREIVVQGLLYYNVSRAELDEFIRGQERLGKQPDRVSVSQALKHFVRDWAVEGSLEREQAFTCVLDALESSYSQQLQGGGSVNVLVPGSGLSRLGHEIASLSPSFMVTTNEYSSFVNLAYRFLVGTSPRPFEHTIHPYLESWSHARRRSELTRGISFPDREVSPYQVLHVEGDFTRVFFSDSDRTSEQAQYDAVVTVFFIDTARNLIAYLETIRSLLKKGGRWINFGPLLYGSAPWLQLTLEEIVQVAEEMGFEFLDLDLRESCKGETLESLRGKVSGREALYNFNGSALNRFGYQGQFWVAQRL